VTLGAQFSACFLLCILIGYFPVTHYSVPDSLRLRRESCGKASQCGVFLCLNTTRAYGEVELKLHVKSLCRRNIELNGPPPTYSPAQTARCNIPEDSLLRKDWFVSRRRWFLYVSEAVAVLCRYILLGNPRPFLASSCGEGRMSFLGSLGYLSRSVTWQISPVPRRVKFGKCPCLFCILTSLLFDLHSNV
jgi:hypothetical protein